MILILIMILIRIVIVIVIVIVVVVVVVIDVISSQNVIPLLAGISPAFALLNDAVNVGDLHFGLAHSLKLRVAPALAPIVARLPGGRHRRFHAYAIGTPRSGTHSIDGMMSKHFRSRHEPDVSRSIPHLLRYLTGEYTDSTMANLLRARDRLLELEMEASHYLHHVVHLLVELFPSAKFVLTIRDPYSWLESEIGRNILTAPLAVWRSLEKERYGRFSCSFQEPESRLKTLENVAPIAAYLSYWREHNEKVLAAVPKERLLILRTDRLSHEQARVAAFLGVELEWIDMESSHRGTRIGPQLRLDEFVPRQFVEENIRRHCGGLMAQFFPEFY